MHRRRARRGQSPDPQAPAPPSPFSHRPLDVTVTVLSLSGGRARDAAGPASSPRSLFSRRGPPPDGSAPTTVVASFANPSGDVETACYAQRSVLSRLAPGLAPQSLRDLV